MTQEPITIWAFLRELIRELENRGFDVETACNDKDQELVDELRNEGIKVNVVDISRSMRPDRVIKAYLEFRRLFKRKKVDMVVTHTPIVSFIVRFAAYFSGVPVIIYTAHGLPFTENMNRWKYLFFLVMEKLAGLVTTGLICINHEDYETAKRLKLVRTGLIKEIHGIGIDTEKYKRSEEDKPLIEDMKRELGIKEGQKVVGFVGRLIEAKGIKEFLEMAEGILEKRKDVVFIVVGYGPLEGYVRKFIEENGLEDNVLFLGFRKDVDKLMKLFDVFVLPTWYPEGMPRTILEAMAMGIPVVTTNVRGCRELVEDGKNGYLVEVGDARGLCEAVEKLIKDFNSMKNICSTLIEKMINNYDVYIIIDKQIYIYNQLICVK